MDSIRSGSCSCALPRMWVSGVFARMMSFIFAGIAIRFFGSLAEPMTTKRSSPRMGTRKIARSQPSVTDGRRRCGIQPSAASRTVQWTATRPTRMHSGSVSRNSRS